MGRYEGCKEDAVGAPGAPAHGARHIQIGRDLSVDMGPGDSQAFVRFQGGDLKKPNSGADQEAQNYPA